MSIPFQSYQIAPIDPSRIPQQEPSMFEQLISQLPMMLINQKLNQQGASDGFFEGWLMGKTPQALPNPTAPDFSDLGPIARALGVR